MRDMESKLQRYLRNLEYRKKLNEILKKHEIKSYVIVGPHGATTVITSTARNVLIEMVAQDGNTVLLQAQQVKVGMVVNETIDAGLLTRRLYALLRDTGALGE